MNVPENKVKVIYHGGPQKDVIAGDPIIKVPYFLYMGTRNAYKNFDRFVIAFSQVAECHKDLLLVCTGGDFNATEMRLLQNMEWKIGLCICSLQKKMLRICMPLLRHSFILLYMKVLECLF